MSIKSTDFKIESFILKNNFLGNENDNTNGATIKAIVDALPASAIEVNNPQLAILNPNVVLDVTLAGSGLKDVTEILLTGDTDNTGISVNYDLSTATFSTLNIQLTLNSVQQGYTLTVNGKQDYTVSFNFTTQIIEGTGVAGTNLEEFAGSTFGIFTSGGNRPFNFSTGISGSTGTITSSAGTGAPNIPAGAGSVPFFEASGATAADTAIISTTDFKKLNQVEFLIHLFGDGAGTLEFQTSADNGVTWTTRWSQNGSLQANLGDAYQTVTIDTSAFAINEIRFIYNGVVNFRADLCLALIELTSV